MLQVDEGAKATVGLQHDSAAPRVVGRALLTVEPAASASLDEAAELGEASGCGQHRRRNPGMEATAGQSRQYTSKNRHSWESRTPGYSRLV